MIFTPNANIRIFTLIPSTTGTVFLYAKFRTEREGRGYGIFTGTSGIARSSVVFT